MVGPDGADLTYYGCTVSIPKGALAEETEITLNLDTAKPDVPGLVVSPVLRLEPSKVEFAQDVTVCLPLAVSAIPGLAESDWPQATLMCCTQAGWHTVEKTRLSYDEFSFHCSHFSAYCYVLDENDNKKVVKRLACFLHKGKPTENHNFEVATSICDDVPHVIEVRECIRSSLNYTASQAAKDLLYLSIYNAPIL